MEGALRAAKRGRDLSYWQAWHGEAFARMKAPDFKRALKTYLAADVKPSVKGAEVLSFMRALKQRGQPVKIKRLN